MFVGLLQAQPGAKDFLSTAFPMILIFGVFWLLVIRPQSRKAKEHQRMLNELKAGDEVVTSGGVLGRITGIRDEEVTLQVQEGVRLRLLRSAISGRHTPGAKSSAKAEVQAS